MNRKLRGGFRSDQGFSVLEVVLAAFIMFFVLTAILGLVATTTRMGLSARQRTAMTNAVSSHLEHMRSIDFDDLHLTPDGTIDAETVVNVDGFTITIITDISDGTGRTREVDITATAVGEGFSPMTSTQSVVIYDSESGVVTMYQAVGPEVVFLSPTPASDAVVYGSQVLGATYQPLYISVQATAEEDESVVADLKMYCSDSLLRDGATIFANYASWQPGTHSVSQSFRWNTLQVGDDGEETIEDGWRVVRVLATDESGTQGMAERRFYVDNYGPGDPGTPSAMIYSDVQTRVSWAYAMDGTDYAPFYVVNWAQIDSSGALGTANTVSGLTTNVFMHATQPFSRYTASVASSNRRGAVSSYFEIPTPYVSRTAAHGQSALSYSGSGGRRQANTTVSLTVDEPTFAVSSIRYDVHRVTPLALGLSATPPALSDPPTPAEEDALAAWNTALANGLRATTAYATDTGPEYVGSYSKIIGNNGTPDRWYYAVKATYVPSGYKGGTTEVMWSDVVGPVILTAGTADMVHVTW